MHLVIDSGHTDNMQIGVKTWTMTLMFRHQISRWIVLASLAITTQTAVAAPPAPRFLSSGQLKVQIVRLAATYPQLLSVLDIGNTSENRHLYVLRIGAADPVAPAVLALFAQHADEHASTNLALGTARTLLAWAARDPGFAERLGKTAIYIVPMVNPDGADYDLLDPGFNPVWRKNRSARTDWQFGVDLNHNWGAFWDAPAGTAAQTAAIRDSASPEFRGTAPFSELETQALRGFVFTHRGIQMLIDYHTGEADFFQGAVLLPYSHGGRNIPVAADLCANSLPERFAATISNTEDKREPYRAVAATRLKELLVEASPLIIRPFTWATTTDRGQGSGTAIDCAASNGLCAMRVEVGLRALKPSQSEEASIVGDHSRGMQLLLKNLQLPPTTQ